MRKVDRLAEKLTSIVSSWDGVEAVVLCNSMDADELDPYFALVLDVYYNKDIPDEDKRRDLFDDPGAFESSRKGQKDRFFLECLPIRLEYKQTASIENIIKNIENPDMFIDSFGTYPVYRLIHGKVLFSRTDWITRSVKSLENTNVKFWNKIFEIYFKKIEHSLSDLGGAALKDDKFFFLISVAGFMQSCASALFAYNHAWEPSDRNKNDVLLQLTLLPEDFISQWSTLMRLDGAISPIRWHQIAQHIAQSILSME